MTYIAPAQGQTVSASGTTPTHGAATQGAATTRPPGGTPQTNQPGAVDAIERPPEAPPEVAAGINRYVALHRSRTALAGTMHTGSPEARTASIQAHAALGDELRAKRDELFKLADTHGISRTALQNMVGRIDAGAAKTFESPLGPQLLVPQGGLNIRNRGR